MRSLVFVISLTLASQCLSRQAVSAGAGKGGFDAAAFKSATSKLKGTAAAYVPSQSDNFFINFAANKNIQTAQDQAQQVADQTKIIAGFTAVGIVLGGVTGLVIGATGGTLVEPGGGTVVGGAAGMYAGAESGGLVFAGVGAAYVAIRTQIDAWNEVSSGQTQQGKMTSTVGIMTYLTGQVAGAPLVGQTLKLGESLGNVAIGTSQATLQTFYGQSK